MISLDGHTAEELGLRIHAEFIEPSVPRTRDVTVSIPGRHGAYYFDSDFDVREFNIPISQEEQKDRREAYFTLNKLKKVLFDGKGKPKAVKLVLGTQPDIYYLVRFSGSLSLQELFRYKRFDLPLVAYDPHGYSLATNNDVTWDSMEVTFMNMEFRLSDIGGSETITTNVTLTYEVIGLDVNPIIRLNGTGTNVRLNLNGQTLIIPQLSGTWVVDLDNFEVTRNGSNALHLIQGNFLEFLQGSNQLRVTGENMNFIMSVDIRNRFI